jgi:chemotaxis protein MotA
MDIFSVLGIILGPGFIIMAFTMEGGNIASLWMTSAFLITIGGSFGTLFLAYGVNQVKVLPKMFIELFMSPKSNVPKTIDYLVNLSQIARQNGLLSLEKTITEADAKSVDPFLKRGIMMVVDGTDPEKISEVLQNDIYVYEQSRGLQIAMLESLGGYGPAFGMVGTITGMIRLLSSGMENPGEMTKSIGIAFIATLYGVAFANLIFLPAASKLRGRMTMYRLEKEMIIEGVCAIRNGVNPRVLQEQLSSYLVISGKKPSSGKAAGKSESA